VNFARDLLGRLPADGLALVELARDGSRREWSFGEVADRTARLAGMLRARGIERGDVVMTLIGNRPEWVLAMCACMRIGAVVLPCTEQLRAKDLRLRIDVARPALIVADERNRSELQAALAGGDSGGGHAGGEVEVVLIPDATLFGCEPAPAVELGEEDPCLITFTSGTAGEPKAVVHSQRYLSGQRVQATQWLGARPPARVGASPRATCSSPRGSPARARCCTTRASIPQSDLSCSCASACECCAWRRPSTA
jgi:acetyl-CoA synthetase